MRRFDERTTANMTVALEKVCHVLPNSGGDHEMRKYIAKKLLQTANKGERTLGSVRDRCVTCVAGIRVDTKLPLLLRPVMARSLST
jgi:hypothetical protein